MSLIADALKKIESKKNNETEEIKEGTQNKETRAERKAAARSFTEEAIEDRETLQNFIASNRKDIRALKSSSNAKKFLIALGAAGALLIAILIYKQYEYTSIKNKVMSAHTNEAYATNSQNSLGRPRGSNEPMPTAPKEEAPKAITTQQAPASQAPQTEAQKENAPKASSTPLPNASKEQNRITDSNFVSNPADINTLIPTKSNVGSSSPLSIIPTSKDNNENIKTTPSAPSSQQRNELKKNDILDQNSSLEPVPTLSQNNKLQPPRNFPEAAPANNPLQNEAINSSLPKPIYFDKGVEAILTSKPINKNSITLTSKALTDTSIKLFNEYLMAGHDSRKAKNYVAAIEYYTSALELAESEEAVMLIAFSYLDMNNANMAFRTVINYSLNNESMLALLAIRTARMGAISDANKMLQYANTLERSNDVIFARGYIYHITNNLKNAGDEYLNILSTEPSYANARYFLAQLYEASGQNELAKNEYKALANMKNIPNDYKMIFLDKGR